MAHVSTIPPLIPYGEFSSVRLEGWRIRRDLPETSISLSLLPAYTVRRPVCLRPSCFSVDPPKVGSVDAMYCTAMRWNAPPTPGALAPVRVMLSRPSTLSRPHPPCSRAHRNFTAQRLICDASAVRERLGHPRAVPVFRCRFLPSMPPPTTPGSSTMRARSQSHKLPPPQTHSITSSARARSVGEIANPSALAVL